MSNADEAPRMIRPGAELEDLDRRYVRDVIAPLSYRQALERFAALWAHALALDPEFPGDWREDVEPDLAVARLLNGFPPERN
jgi:hypothetical protein